jgi:nucleoside-diphosphate-sugar epimerase
MSKVIGEGVIAERFHHLNTQFETLVFAPNPENSQMVVSTQFEEETNELRRLIGLHPSSKIVYFSSCSVLDPSLMTSSYVIYKKSIEELIQKLAPNYLIVRLPQVVSRESEESNLSRYIVDRVLSGEPFEVWSGAIRNFIDLDDVFEIVRGLLHNQKFRNKIINVANLNSVPVIDFVQTVESVFGLEAKYQIIDKSSDYEIDVSAISGIVSDLKINFDDSYLDRTIAKYYEYRTKGPILLLMYWMAESGTIIAFSCFPT